MSLRRVCTWFILRSFTHCLLLHLIDLNYKTTLAFGTLFATFRPAEDLEQHLIAWSGGEKLVVHCIESLRDDLNNEWVKKIIAARGRSVLDVGRAGNRRRPASSTYEPINLSIHGHHVPSSISSLTTILSAPFNYMNRHVDRS